MDMVSFTKLGRTIELEVPSTYEECVETWGLKAATYIFDYGRHQCLADGGAVDKDATADDWEGKLRKRWDRVRAGEMTYRRGGPKRSREERERDLVTENTSRDIIESKKGEGAWAKLSKEQQKAYMVYIYDRRRDAIEEEVARRMAGPAIEIDDDLDLDSVVAPEPAAVPANKRDTRKSKG